MVAPAADPSPLSAATPPPTDAQLATSLTALERTAALEARRLGLTGPRRPARPAPAADPIERSERLGQVIGFLRQRRERAPMVDAAAATTAETTAAGSSLQRAHARVARHTERVGIVPPPVPAPASDPGVRDRQAERLRAVSGWLAERRERERDRERNAAAAAIALEQRGTPYAWGGASPSGFDCSGLAMYAFSQVGVALAHNTNAIWGALPKVRRSDLAPGDMVFFRGLGHMGIYIGGGRYVHAPSSGDVVKVTRLSERDDYVGAVRA